MNILSLFDGMSCGQIALNKNKIKIDNYYASEIKKNAIETTQRNFPNTIQIGDITKVYYKDGILYTENGDFNVETIDILIGGSPCQSFSFVGKREGMKTESKIDILTLEDYLDYKKKGFKFSGQSYLFWEYVRLLKEVNPKYFLLENVVMAKKWEDIITKNMGVNPIKINSSLLSAQNRPRLYWTNIKVKEPEDLKVSFQDYKLDTITRVEQLLRDQKFKDSNIDLDLKDYEIDYIYNKNFWAFEEFKEIKKDISKEEFVDEIHNLLKESTPKVTPFRIRIWKDGTCDGRNYTGKNITNADKIATISTRQDRCPNSGLIKFGDFYRYLSKIELCKCQTIPYKYLNHLSYNKLCDLVGNGWTVDIISYILENIEETKKSLFLCIRTLNYLK